MEQNFKNHRQVVYSYYIFTGLPILLLIGLAIQKIINNNGGERETGLLFLLVGWILLSMLFRSRGFALKAQDRAIRAEENLRHFILTGKPLAKALRLSQVIALRFASDEEFAALCERAEKENMDSKSIKMAIKSWRADHHRV